MNRVTVTSLLVATFVATLAAAPAQAGHQLTDPQLATLKADSATPCSGLTDQACADLYNAAASPDFWVWRTSVSKAELTNSTSVDGTTFSWVGTGFITRSQGERDAWRELFDAGGNVNPSLPQVRTAFTDIFSGGTAPAPALRRPTGRTSQPWAGERPHA